MVVYIFLGHSGRKFLCNLTLGIRFLPIFGIIHGIIPGITTLIPEIIPGITTLIPEIIPGITTLIPVIISGITTPIPGIMPGITTPIPGIIPETSVRKHTSIKRDDTNAANIIANSAKFAETTIKLLWNIEDAIDKNTKIDKIIADFICINDVSGNPSENDRHVHFV